MKTIKVGEKTFAKSAIFGNQKSQTIFKNRKNYSRKDNSWKKD
jgi:hypothetical protein